MKNISNSIFKVNTSLGSGSAFFLNDEKIYITNFHVVDGCKMVSIEDQNKHSVVAKVALVDPDTDLAILTTESNINSSEMLLADINSVKSRDEVYVLGFPFGMPYTETKGIVSSPKQLMQGKYYIQTDAPVNPGNSGGPIVNINGDVIGVTTSKFNNADNMGFAVPVDVLKKFIDIYLKNKPANYSVVCTHCKNIATEKTSHCDHCGGDINANLFDEKPITELARRIESGLTKNGINPILARSGYEYWNFYQGSAKVRIYIYDYDFICSSASLNDYPTENIEGVMRYLLSDPIPPYQLGSYGNTIQIGSRCHISDLFSAKYGDTELDKIINLAQKADEMDNLLYEQFGCPHAATARL